MNKSIIDIVDYYINNNKGQNIMFIANEIVDNTDVEITNEILIYITNNI